MGRLTVKLAVLVLWAGIAGGCATPDLPASLAIPTMPNDATAVEVPPGFISFCIRFPDQCYVPPGAANTIALNDATWRKLNRTNVAVNEAIWPQDDQTHFGRS